MIGTLTRYLVFGVAQRTILTLIILLFVYAVFDLIELQTTLNRPISELLSDYIYKVPTILGQMIPLAGAISIALTVSALKKNGEWRAIGALGFPPERIYLSLLVVPFFLTTVVSAALLFQIAPKALASIHGGSLPVDHSEFRWIQHKRWLLRIDKKKDIASAIRLSSPNRPLAKFEKTKDQWQKWTNDSGWITVLSGPNPPETNIWSKTQRLGTFQGAMLTYTTLSSEIENRRRMGLRTRSLEAEMGLRIVLLMATWMIPLATLLFNTRFSSGNSAYLTGHAILMAALFWLVTAFLWNGIQMGIWSYIWLIIGAPILYIVAVTFLISISRIFFLEKRN